MKVIDPAALGREGPRHPQGGDDGRLLPVTRRAQTVNPGSPMLDALLREIALEQASGEQVTRLLALADAAAEGEPIIRRCAVALAIERQHAARETFSGLHALHQRMLALHGEAHTGRTPDALLVLLDSLGILLANLYLQVESWQLDRVANDLLELASEPSTKTAYPELHARFRLRAANALLGFSELKDGSAAIRTRLESIAADAARILPPNHRDVIDWWAEWAVIESFLINREKRDDARLLAVMAEQKSRLQTLPGEQTSGHFKWWRARIEWARAVNDPAAAVAAFDAITRTIAPHRKAHLLTYLRILAHDYLHRKLPLESERTAREALRVAQAIDAPYTDIATIANTLAQALVLQSRWQDAAQALNDAERISHAQIALHLRTSRLLFESAAAWDIDRRRAIGLLREGFAANRSVLKFNFLLAHPALASKFAARALAQDIETEFVNEAVRRRALPAPSCMAAKWPWRAQIRLFGSFALVSDAPSSRPGSKAQHRPVALLQALALAGPEGADRRTVMRRMYGSAEAVEPAALDMAVGRARKMLGGDELIVFDQGRLRIDHQYVFVDVWAFEALDQTLSSLQGASSPLLTQAEDVRELARLLSTLYAGPLLFGETSDIARDTQVQRYRERFVASLATRMKR
jgi:hypothetical protein